MTAIAAAARPNDFERVPSRKPEKDGCGMIASPIHFSQAVSRRSRFLAIRKI
jgi:hypothetical protein